MKSAPSILLRIKGMSEEELNSFVDIHLSTREAATKKLLRNPNPRIWPHYPYLPMTKKMGYRPACHIDNPKGIVLAGNPTIVRLVNLFLLPDTLIEFLALPFEEYLSVEDLIRDGWLVDD